MTSALRAGVLMLAFTAGAATAEADPANGMPSGSAPVEGSSLSQSCAAPIALTTIQTRLDRSGRRIAAAQPIRIVAMGSSSTQGVGASGPTATYPAQLTMQLRRRYPGLDIEVVNKGIGGEDFAEEIARFSRDVLALHPDLVIWQVGTNAVLRRDDLAVDESLVERGVAMLKAQGIDVVLMDLQYAPRVLDRPAIYPKMQRLLADTAKVEHVGLFRRFAVMEHWTRMRQMEPAELIGPDGLHMTDLSYACLAAQLAASLTRNWRMHDIGAAPLTAAVGKEARPLPRSDSDR